MDIEKTADIISTVVSSGPAGWIIAGVALLLIVGVSIVMGIRGKKNRLEKDKREAGAQAGQDANTSAGNLDDTRSKSDDFLNRK